MLGGDLLGFKRAVFTPNLVYDVHANLYNLYFDIHLSGASIQCSANICQKPPPAQVLSDYVKKYQSNIYVFAQCQYHRLVTNAHNYQSSVWKNKNLAAFVYYCYDY